MLAEATQSLYGGWRMFLRDPSAMRFFNVSLGGFWRSFLVAIPAILLSLIATTRFMNPDTKSPDRLLAADGVTIALSYALYPLVIAILARKAGLTRNFAGFIIAINWTSLVFAGVYALVAAVIGAYAATSELAALILIGMVVGLFAYQLLVTWFLAQTALRADQRTSIIVVAISVGLNFALTFTLGALFGV